MLDHEECFRRRWRIREWLLLFVIGAIAHPPTAFTFDFDELWVFPNAFDTILLRPDEQVALELFAFGSLANHTEFVSPECEFYQHGGPGGPYSVIHWSCRENTIYWGVGLQNGFGTVQSDEVGGNYFTFWTPSSEQIGTRFVNVEAEFGTSVIRSEFDGCVPSCPGGHFSELEGAIQWSTVLGEPVKVVVTDVHIDSIEITQSIQESLEPLELRDYLRDNFNEAPVPLVADKPGAVRVFLSEVQEPTPVRVEFWAKNLGTPGSLPIVHSKDFDLLPNCTPLERRQRYIGGGRHCRSIDFRFKEGEIDEGQWAIWVGMYYRVEPPQRIIEPHHSNIDTSLTTEWSEFLVDYGYLPGSDPDGSPHGDSLLPDSTGTLNPVTTGGLEDYKFVVNVTKSDELVIHGVSVCDGVHGVSTNCEDVGKIVQMSGLLKKLAPTDAVTVKTLDTKIDGIYNLPTSPGMDPVCTTPSGVQVPWTSAPPIYCEGLLWWVRILKELDNIRTRESASFPASGAKHIVYGVTPPDISGAAGAAIDNFPLVAASMSSVPTDGLETNVSTMAHEVSHTLGNIHTDTEIPKTVVSPGCWGTAKSGATTGGWPYVDNHLQSGPPDAALKGVPEVGYDYKRNQVRAAGGPRESFELMSYCIPRWTTSWSTRKMLESINPAHAPLSAASVAPIPDFAFGTFWLVSGSADAGGAILQPLVELATNGPVDPGSGTHRLEAQGANGAVLAARSFTPVRSQHEVPDVAAWSEPMFAELLPVMAGTARIVLLDDAGVELTSTTLGGSPPTASLLSPAGGEQWQGLQDVVWLVDDLDSPETYAWIDYSDDAGLTWHSVVSGSTANPQAVDFDLLPGSAGNALIRLSVSDGSTTHSVVSPPFSVEQKLPTAEILAPADGASFNLGDTAVLEGAGFDVDDGVIAADGLSWDLVGFGPLGTGQELEVDVDEAGSFTVVLTVTDSDANVATASIDVEVLPDPLIEQSSGNAPVAIAGGAYNAFEGTSLEISGAASFDPDGNALSYLWDFGGGDTAAGETVAHTFADDGLYPIDLDVTDVEALTGSDSTTADVENVAPRVDTTWSANTDVDVPVLLEASFEDPGLQDAPWTVTWDFGDGTSPVSYQTSDQGPINQPHTFTTGVVGVDAFYPTVTVMDKDGGTSTAEMVVYVPEPENWLMILSGICLLACFWARRCCVSQHSGPRPLQ